MTYFYDKTYCLAEKFQNIFGNFEGGLTGLSYF